MTDTPPARWILPEGGPSEEWEGCGTKQGIPLPVLRVLWRRGLRSVPEALRFLRPDLSQLEDPNLLTDLPRAVARIRRALARGERILVFGDYDVDGLTSAALFTHLLRHFGAQVLTLVPNRMEEGFGLSPKAVETAAEAGAALLVSCDCGTTAHAAVARAVELGIDVIVADHHVPDAELPPLHALVNPRRPGEPYPFPDLASVGVVFKVLQGLVDAAGNEADRRVLYSYCDLAALGTVADVVPLRGENRVLVHHGLEVLRQGPRPCMRALLELAELQAESLQASHLAFFLAPRLNASGRLGSPERSLGLLLARDEDEARLLAEEVEGDNRERRRLQLRVLEETLRLLEGRTQGEGPIVLASDRWHPGVLGIAASRLVDRFRVPAVLVSLQGETARGSARTPPGADLLSWIRAAGEHLQEFGGHRQAVGFSMAADRFEEFRRALLEAKVPGFVAGEDPGLVLDGGLDPAACDLELVRRMEELAPFGMGNEEPLFVGRALCRRAYVQQGRHLRMRAGKGARALDCVGFGLGDRAAEIPEGGAVCELIYRPTLNRFRGEERVQLKVRDVRLEGSALD